MVEAGAAQPRQGSSSMFMAILPGVHDAHHLKAIPIPCLCKEHGLSLSVQCQQRPISVY